MNGNNFCKQDGTDLKELFNSQIINVKSLIDANDRNYNQRFDNVTTATQAALAAADRAVNKAEGASEKRFDAVNEFRATLADQQRTLMPRIEVEILNKALNDKIEKMNSEIIQLQGQNKGLREGWGWAVGVFGIIIAIATIAIRISLNK